MSILDLFTKSEYKLYFDESGKGLKEDRWQYYELRGRRGRIYPYNERQLAAQAYRGEGMQPTHFVKTRGYEVIQDADDMLVFLFPEHDFKTVAEMLELKPKKVLSPEHLQKLAEARAKRFK